LATIGPNPVLSLAKASPTRNLIAPDFAVTGLRMTSLDATGCSRTCNAMKKTSNYTNNLIDNANGVPNFRV
jgi:hypothetical protein